MSPLGPRGGAGSRSEDAGRWSAARVPSREWLANWAAVDPRLPRAVIDAHVTTVFQNIGRRGVYGRLGELASGILVEDPACEWAGLFSLVVREDQRGRGLGRELVLRLLEETSAPRIYLQVQTDKTVARALYESLGFRITHSYRHLNAPQDWA